MGWKEALSKLRIIDVKVKPEAEQIGIINIQIENKTFNYNFGDPGTITSFLQNSTVTPELEQNIKEEVTQRLTPIGLSLDMISDPNVAPQVVAATTATSTAAFFFRKKK